jgi:acetate CoA/acetoacetate CoA-transferase alpha subunit
VIDMAHNKMTPIDEAVARVESGMTLALGGFLSQGVPLTLIRALKTRPVHDLVIYSNDGGFGDDGVVELVKAGMVRELHCCHIGYTPAVGRAVENGELELVWAPQGNLIEMLRCGGAGLGGFLTPTGVGTVAEQGKQVIELDGRRYILVPAVKCDIAIVRAHAGDTWGNLIYRGTSRNFNVPAAMNAHFTIAEVENLYTLGELDPNAIHTSGIFVNAVVRANVEYCTIREEKFNG